MSSANYDYWREALAGGNPAVHENAPQPGFYRTKGGKGREPEPVAIFEHNGALVALRSGNPVDPGEVWTWVCTSPISHDVYEAVAERGEPWPDQPAENPRAVAGNNSGDLDAFATLRRELEGEQEITAAFLAKPITLQEEADRAGVWAKRVAGLKTRADREFETEKAPHLAACRAVDEKWRDLRADAEALAKKLKRHAEPFLIEQQRLAKERERQAQEEARRLREQGSAERAAEVEQAGAAKNASAGRTGARIALRTVQRERITDLPALAAFYAGMETPPADLTEVLLKLARRNISAGVMPPGVEVYDAQVAA